MSTTSTNIASRAVQNLESVIAIDSHSDESSSEVPSTTGQRELCSFLGSFFRESSFETEIDANGNLIAFHPGTGGPPLALMIHVDTALGTDAVPELLRESAWNGEAIPYPKNPQLQVSVRNYPETSPFLGQELLFGPGTAPVGLDDKLGLAQIMTLSQLIGSGELDSFPDMYLVCRPDEEIGRMSILESLADTLAQKGIRHGYTIDGIAPFEINLENFNAAQATLCWSGIERNLPHLKLARRIEIRVDGVKSHGATAKAEGYLNATTIFVQTMGQFSRRLDILPLDFNTDDLSETSADISFIVRGDTNDALDELQQTVVDVLQSHVDEAIPRGANISVQGHRAFDMEAFRDHSMRLTAVLSTFRKLNPPDPLLSEESDGFGGYSNPYSVKCEEGKVTLKIRLRDFSAPGLEERKAHIRRVAESSPGKIELSIQDQYQNMGDRIRERPELLAWAQKAADAAGVPAVQNPIRGGTGVDPFLDRGTCVANLGTGYFAPESEKEFTSVEMLERHVQWLCELLKVVASA